MTTKEQIIARIKAKGHGYAFSPKDFLDLGNRDLVDKTLSNLTASGIIRRISRGLYDRPRISKLLGEPLSPDIDQAAQAIARKHRWTIAPDGAMAANLLGLSRQVPAKIVYLSDGPHRKYCVGKQIVVFRHANPKDLRMENYSSRLISQALRFLGKGSLGKAAVLHLRKSLQRKEKINFLKDARYGTDWIFDFAQRIAKEDAHG